MNDELKDRIRGMMFGQALGDAVGLITEFKFKRDHPKAVFPYKESVRGWTPNDWTDDTDQAVLLLQTMIECGHDFESDRFTADDLKIFARKLESWVRRGFPELGDKAGLGLGGNTCMVVNHNDFLHDPLKASQEVWINSGKKLAANGAIMRAAPLALCNLFGGDAQPFFDNVRATCQTTHYDPRCIMSCWVYCCCLRLLLLTKLDPKAIIMRVRKLVDGRVSQLPTIDGAVANAFRHQPTPKIYLDQNFYRDGKYDFKAEFEYYLKHHDLKSLDLDEIGKIGYTYKCLGSALWALEQTNRGFKEVIVELAEECGDADTNCAVAGAILGARKGFAGLPTDWVDALPHRDWLHRQVDACIAALDRAYKL